MLVLLFLQPLFPVVPLFVWSSMMVCVSCSLFVLHYGVTACIESMFKLIMLRAAVSGIPNNAWQFPGTTKNTHCFLNF